MTEFIIIIKQQLRYLNLMNKMETYANKKIIR